MGSPTCSKKATSYKQPRCHMKGYRHQLEFSRGGATHVNKKKCPKSDLVRCEDAV